ncbi:MAG: hypothetical protein WBQ60_07080 [Asticcacaulis sp.]
MNLNIFLYISKRSQRIVMAFLCLILMQVVVASCTPDAVAPMAARISLK